MKTWFYSREHREQTIAQLKAMPLVTRRLLAQVVEAQSVKRQKLSASATALETAGLVFCDRPGDWELWTIKPSLWGEEALHRLEIRERKERDQKRTTRRH